MRQHLSSVTIYNNPADFPGFFVARRFFGEFATADHFVHLNIESVRAWARGCAHRFNESDPVCLGRFEEDSPHIVETWV